VSEVLRDEANVKSIAKVASIISVLAGILVIALVVAADWIGLGSPGFGPMQCLLMLAGFAVSLFGIALPRVATERTTGRIWRLTGTKPWRVLSLLLVFVGILELGGVLALIGPVAVHELVHHRPAHLQMPAAQDAAAVSQVSIPVRFLPDYDIERLSDGTVTKTLKYGRGTIETTSDKVALVLVDTWEYSSDPMPEPVGHYKNIAALLDEARAHGVTIIHAPNHPVVDKYPQYHSLHREVDAFLETSLAGDVVRMLPWTGEDRGYERIYGWPPPEFRREVDAMRQEAIQKHYLGRPSSERDIAWFLCPRENEFVVQSSDELRYVLWLRKIYLLLYAGGATNECILHRPTGVLNLVGSDYVIVLLGDCTAPSPSPGCENQVVQKVFEDYYMRTTIGGYVANSKEIVWQAGE
jgi:nicotinamidase-related amidase